MISGERNNSGAFRRAVDRPDEAIALDHAALLAAQQLAPGVDVERGLRRLDELASEAGEARLERLVGVLFGEGGFSGNQQQYYDPRNSYLDVVLERRLGIPITLAVVTIEVGRRIGLELVGVGMPGHFLVATTEPVPRYVDVFHGGQILGLDGCERLFERVNGAQAPFQSEYLRPVGRAEILYRMLTNLRMVFQSTGDRAGQIRAMVLQNHLRIASPEDATALASVLGTLGRWTQAAELLERSARRHPGSADELRAAAASMWSRLN